MLSGKYHSEDDAGQSGRGLIADARLNGSSMPIIDALITIAKEIQQSPAAVALRWIQHKYHRIIPILGARTLKQLQDNLSALECELNSDQLSRLNEISSITLGFPYDILEDNKPNMPGMNDGIHGVFKADMLSEVARRSVRS